MGSTPDHLVDTEEEEQAFTTALLLGSTTVLSMSLKAAIQLGVIEIIVKAGIQLSPVEIAAQLPAKNPGAATMLDRILRLLASYNVITCSLAARADGSVERRYGANRVAKFLTKDEDGASLGGLVLMNQDKVPMETWHYLKDTVLEGGIPFNKAHGVTAFEYQGIDPRFNKVFNESMKGHSVIIMKKILERYRGLDNVKVLVDVGGGVGGTLSQIVSFHPHLHGINFDLPHVISDAPPLPGVEHFGGDMFESVPTGDAIFLKWILHDWSDEECLKILKNCWKALPDNGKVILIDCILPVDAETTPTARGVFHTDLVMLAYNPGGKERTKDEFSSLAKEAGFSGLNALFKYSATWVIELYK